MMMIAIKAKAHPYGRGRGSSTAALPLPLQLLIFAVLTVDRGGSGPALCSNVLWKNLKCVVRRPSSIVVVVVCTY